MRAKPMKNRHVFRTAVLMLLLACLAEMSLLIVFPQSPGARALSVAGPEGLYWQVQLPSNGTDPAPVSYEGDVSFANTTSCSTDCWHITAQPTDLLQYNGPNAITGQGPSQLFLTVNGSSTSSSATTPPNVVPTGCGSGTVSDGVSYPVTFSYTAPPGQPSAAVIARGTLSLAAGQSNCTLQFFWWLLVGSGTYVGRYSGTLVISIGSGP
jgi:hypothetical protein